MLCFLMKATIFAFETGKSQFFALQKRSSEVSSTNTTYATMGWFSSGLSAPQPSSQQISQQSHKLLNLAGNPDSSAAASAAPRNGNYDSDINQTLNQLASDEQKIQLKQLTADSLKETNKSVADFVLQKPRNLFIIDGEKYADESIICTNNENGGKTCLKLRYNSIELFKQMQKLEYFCSLPNDINATYFECRKIT